ncbi:synaptotagmin-13 isoform X1 [Osmerus eperlanus]|uniref:synaptotagmin-13 isoform X1 n=1 Tax=Osmerus eperlanus TaxID=29151 RepID=UPI002E14174B
MIFSTAAILGATMGTASGVLTLCGLSLFCRSCRRSKLEDGDECDPEKPTAGVLTSLQQFRVVKSTESIQPQTLLKFPKIYQPKPSVNCPEVINYPVPDPIHDFAPEGSQQLSHPEPSSQTDKGGNQATGSSDVAVVPRQDSCEEPQCAGESANDTVVSSLLHPKLHFSLTYHSQAQELHITVIEAERVTASQGSEGYVSGVLTCGSFQREAQTSRRPLSKRVRWQEGLVFSVPGPGGCQGEGEVALTLLSCDRFSHHANLGSMRFKLADVGMMSDSDCWVDLQPPKQQEVLSAGELLLSITYLPAANRLGVVVMKARGLPSDKLKDCIDLSVKLTLKHQSTKLKKKQTRRVKHKMNPVWNEMMMLEVPRDLLTRSSLELEVLNQAGQGQGPPQNQAQCLGRCQLGLQASSTGLQHWQQMLDNPRKQIAMWHPLNT